MTHQGPAGVCPSDYPAGPESGRTLPFGLRHRAFRQQLATDPSIRWNAINLSLLASTTLGHRSTGAHTFCTLCGAVDHTCTQCALTFLEPAQTASVSAMAQCGPSQGVSRRPQSPPVCFSWNRGACPYGNKCADTNRYVPSAQLPLTKHQTVHKLWLDPLQLITPAVLEQKELNSSSNFGLT